jgi:hypothetical protein
MRGRFRRSMGMCPFGPLVEKEGYVLREQQLMWFYRVINLTKNSQLYVRQGDVERLIAQGFLERLS